MHGVSVTDFRNRARAWLEENAPRRASADGESEPRPGPGAGIAAQKAFQARLYDAGFAGITWPREYGGQGLTNAEQIAFSQEARDFALPVSAFIIGLGMPGPTILELGTEEQKKRYLPRMLRGEEIWCQLFSEPGGGSDVACLITTAVRDGDEWVLNGQKVWTSGAQYSDYGAIIARTDPTVPKHNGITMFIVDMHAPGVTVRPLKVATGATPRSTRSSSTTCGCPRNRSSARSTRAGRRPSSCCATSASPSAPWARHGPARCPTTRCATWPRASAAPATRAYGASWPSSTRASRAVQLFALLLRQEAHGRAGRRVRAARSPSSRALSWHVRRAHRSRRAGPIGWPGSTATTCRRSHLDRSAAPGNSIAGGTDEIQRNIIGERVLGLAKDPGVDRATPFNQLRVGTLRQH